MDKLIKKISSKLPQTSVAGKLKPALTELSVGFIGETNKRIKEDPRHKGTTTLEFEIDGYNAICIYIPTLKKWSVVLTNGNTAYKCFVFDKPEAKSKCKVIDPKKLSQKELEHYVFDLGYTEWEKYLK